MAGRKQTAMKTARNRRITSREWLSLGVLAVNAADEANRHGNKVAVNYYTKLAKQCDTLAELEEGKPS